MSIIKRIRLKWLRTFAPLYPDKLYLQRMFPLRIGYKLDLDNPRTFNEKLQWLKLYDRNPLYCKMVDKVEAKRYAAEVLGTDENIIPTLAVYNRAEDIDFDALPNQFVLKCTHDSGGIVICDDKSILNREAAIEKLRRGLNTNYFYLNREWPYKNVKPRILAEQYLKPNTEINDLRDYKFFCFNGKVKCFKIDFNRHTDHHANYYDRVGHLLPFGEKNYLPQINKSIDIPDNLGKMINLAETLSMGKKFLRVDLYNIQGKIFFGEMTFYPASGMGKLEPEEWDLKLGEWIELPNA